jgi:chromosome segregation ATPase
MVHDSPGETADGRADRIRLEQLLTESEQRLAAVPTLEVRIAELERELAAAHEQAAAARRRADDLEAELTRSVEALAQLTHSASWQVTRPLRRAQQILR